MSTDKQSIIEKIKKLLRMKRGGTPDEIETALALAAELARKHGIDLGAVDPDVQEERPITHEDILSSTRIQWECKYAGLVCSQFFNVNLLLRQGAGGQSFSKWDGRRGWRDWRLTFIGTEWDIQIATYVYGFLVQHMRWCWNHRRGRGRKRQPFLYGMYHGICNKLTERKQAQVSGEGVILLDRQLARREDYLARAFGEIKETTTTPDGDALASQYAGYLAGRDTEIRGGLTTEGRATPMLA